MVKDASISFEIPDGNLGNNAKIYTPDKDSTSGISAMAIAADNRFTSVYGIGMKAGTFYEGGSQDSMKLVINESAARALGWFDPQKALNQPLKFFNSPATFYIKGVTKDIQFGSMRDKIQPTFFSTVEGVLVYRHLSIKLNDGSISQQIASLQKEWKRIFPHSPFDYKFIDDNLAKMYETETRMRKAARLATIVAFILVTLGILGISAMSITRRTKEVGIRKVLGATYTDIVILFVREFSWIIIASNLVAWPLAWYLLNKWLNTYSYRIDLDISPFLIVGIVIIGLVLAVIMLMLGKTLRTNPVKSLQID
ncbi:hypothetical protein DVR12_10270 [Chitinophaga silvatica]|uniref:ABC3 transporter permease C-terminal domain-containing protein n=1 Tax=Chitinophaga silvatica TaxID=2282649 RepID=A0A3E1YBG3_9BACT|nr:FtsX-like permease family protein [Chitinophaga silvatica]RFS23392.1 hypothetical protein DVR12_10270 [Chitinophaga silvatica]